MEFLGIHNYSDDVAVYIIQLRNTTLAKDCINTW